MNFGSGSTPTRELDGSLSITIEALMIETEA
jgi:hypothetical protein